MEGHFLPAPSFGGAVERCVYKRGPRGLGYYEDVPTAARAGCPSDLLRAVVPPLTCPPLEVVDPPAPASAFPSVFASVPRGKAPAVMVSAPLDPLAAQRRCASPSLDPHAQSPKANLSVLPVTTGAGRSG